MSTEKAPIIADLPDVETIERDVNKIVSEKFSKLKLIGSQGFWHLGYTDAEGSMNPRFSLHFWRENDTTLEFSHRKTHPFMWWVEFEVREKLAKLYNGVTTEDSVEGRFASCDVCFDSFSEYLNAVFKDMDWLVEESMSSIPPELEEYKK